MRTLKIWLRQLYQQLENKKLAKPAVIVTIALIGFGLLIATQAATPSISIEPENGTKTNVGTLNDASASGGQAIQFGGGTGAGVCGKRVQNYSYAVPFGNAVWNQPVCNLPRYPKSTEYANRFLEWGHVNDGNPSEDYKNGHIDAGISYANEPTIIDPDGLAGVYTREVNYASEATSEKRISSLTYESNLDGTANNSNPTFAKPGAKSNHPDGKIPWNPNWKTGMGGDNEIFIIDDRPGKNNNIYTIWGYNMGNCILDSIFFPDRVCGASIDISRNHAGEPINIMTHEGYVSERGVGLSYYATLTTPEEVAAGEIRHALGVTLPNTSFGEKCLDHQLGTNAEGTTCGTAVAPASKFEWSGAPEKTFLKEPYKSIYTIDKTIPEGMRFAIDITDSQIEAWLSTRPYKNNPRRVETARIFARALRDYGMIVVDTNDTRPGIQTVGGINPKHKAMWINLAMGPNEKEDLLTDLVTKNNLYVVDPPTVMCSETGKPSKNYCRWTSATYQR